MRMVVIAVYIVVGYRVFEMVTDLNDIYSGESLRRMYFCTYFFSMMLIATYLYSYEKFVIEISFLFEYKKKMIFFQRNEQFLPNKRRKLFPRLNGRIIGISSSNYCAEKKWHNFTMRRGKCSSILHIFLCKRLKRNFSLRQFCASLSPSFFLCSIDNWIEWALSVD